MDMSMSSATRQTVSKLTKQDDAATAYYEDHTHVESPGTPQKRPGHPLVDTGIIQLVLAEYTRVKQKHGEHTLDGALSNDLLRLAALVEEVGEAAHELTYDRAHVYTHVKAMDGTGEIVTLSRDERLQKELIQVANVALTWASIL
jgi:hypothetical protein